MDTLKIKRKIDSTSLQIDELRDWVGKEVDITIKENITKPKTSKSTAAGLLAEFKDNERIDNEKNGWTKAVKDKHGNC